MLLFFSEKLPLILYSKIERFIKPVIGILSVYFSPINIIRFAYSRYFRNRLNIRDIPDAATRDIAFRNLRIRPFP
jgi:hypothetical protein